MVGSGGPLLLGGPLVVLFSGFSYFRSQKLKVTYLGTFNRLYLGERAAPDTVKKLPKIRKTAGRSSSLSQNELIFKNS